MPPKRWTTRSQQAYLDLQMPDYIRRHAQRKLHLFWPAMEEGWFHQFSEQAALGLPLANSEAARPLTVEELALLGERIKARKKQLASWFRREAKKIRAGPVGPRVTISPLATALMKKARKSGRRVHHAVEVFQKRNKAKIRSALSQRGFDSMNEAARRAAEAPGEESDEEEALEEQEGHVKASRAARMQLRTSVVSELWANASDEEREAVRKEVEREREELRERQREEEMVGSSGEDKTPEEYQSGGPSPRHNGALIVKVICAGETPQGNTFRHACPNFNEEIVDRFKEFLMLIYPFDVRDSRALPRPAAPESTPPTVSQLSEAPEESDDDAEVPLAKPKRMPKPKKRKKKAAAASPASSTVSPSPSSPESPPAQSVPASPTSVPLSDAGFVPVPLSPTAFVLGVDAAVPPVDWNGVGMDFGNAYSGAAFDPSAALPVGGEGDCFNAEDGGGGSLDWWGSQEAQEWGMQLGAAAAMGGTEMVSVDAARGCDGLDTSFESLDATSYSLPSAAYSPPGTVLPVGSTFTSPSSPSSSTPGSTFTPSSFSPPSSVAASSFTFSSVHGSIFTLPSLPPPPSVPASTFSFSSAPGSIFTQPSLSPPSSAPPATFTLPSALPTRPVPRPVPRPSSASANGAGKPETGGSIYRPSALFRAFDSSGRKASAWSSPLRPTVDPVPTRAAQALKNILGASQTVGVAANIMRAGTGTGGENAAAAEGSARAGNTSTDSDDDGRFDLPQSRPAARQPAPPKAAKPMPKPKPKASVKDAGVTAALPKRRGRLPKALGEVAEALGDASDTGAAADADATAAAPKRRGRPPKAQAEVAEAGAGGALEDVTNQPLSIDVDTTMKTPGGRASSSRVRKVPERADGSVPEPVRKGTRGPQKNLHAAGASKKRAAMDEAEGSRATKSYLQLIKISCAKCMRKGGKKEADLGKLETLEKEHRGKKSIEFLDTGAAGLEPQPADMIPFLVQINKTKRWGRNKGDRDRGAGGALSGGPESITRSEECFRVAVCEARARSRGERRVGRGKWGAGRSTARCGKISARATGGEQGAESDGRGAAGRGGRGAEGGERRGAAGGERRAGSDGACSGKARKWRAAQAKLGNRADNSRGGRARGTRRSAFGRKGR
ncbi:hypothetical protein DFH09DRAFT_1100887 [Mycena vulgaris]|nr:hypothetical protein DFH09DRAFT_1100887 [Mycena vulgaris]